MVKRHVMTRYIICLLTSVNFTKTIFFNKKKLFTYFAKIHNVLQCLPIEFFNFVIITDADKKYASNR